MSAIEYRISYKIDNCNFRRDTVTVLAKDVPEALGVANAERKRKCRSSQVCDVSPSWIDSDSSKAPDAISESVLRRYAEKIGMDLVPKISNSNCV